VVVRVVPVAPRPRDLEAVEEAAAGWNLVLAERRAVARVVELDAVPVDARRMVELVLEVHDHRVADVQAELRPGHGAVERLHAGRHAVADVDGRLHRDDRGLDDVRVGVGVAGEGRDLAGPSDLPGLGWRRSYHHRPGPGTERQPFLIGRGAG
jgi:hypothetical protein